MNHVLAGLQMHRLEVMYLKETYCRYVFVEYGPMELDLNLRVRIDELEKYLAAQV